MYYLTDRIHYYIFAQNNQLCTMVKLKDGFTGERALVLPRIIVDKMEEDPLTSMLHITDIGYYPKAKHHFRILPDRRPGIYRLRQSVFYSSGRSPAFLCFQQIDAMDYLLDSLQRYSCSVLCQRRQPSDGYSVRTTLPHQYADQPV